MQSPSVVDIEVTREQNGSLAPRLDTAPALLYNLGFCLAVSSTRSVARVVLPETAPAGPALSTNMIRIANEGSNAFLGAYKDLLNIANSSEELSQDGGLLDQLGGLLMHGGTKTSKNLVYSWVQDCVNSCSAAGQRTAGNFDNWRNTVQLVSEAVDTAKNSSVAKIKMTKDARKVTEHRVRHNKLEMSAAMEEVIYAVQKQEAKSKVYETRVGAHEGHVSEQLREYLYNPFWSAVKRPFKAAADKTALRESENLRAEAEEELHEAFRELNQRRKAEMAFKLKAERLSTQIEECLDEEANLDDIVSTIGDVCELLGGLSSDVSALLHTFAKLSEEIKRLVEIRQRLDKPAGINLGFTRLNLFNKKPTFVVAEKKDEAFMNRLFLQQILRMKQVCLGIHVLAKLYADIINDVINYGFAEALRASYDNLGETTTTSIVRQPKKRMKQWHDQALLVCSERNRTAARDFQARLEAMGQYGGPPAGSPPFMGGGQFGRATGPFGQQMPMGMGMGMGYPPGGFGMGSATGTMPQYPGGPNDFSGYPPGFAQQGPGPAYMGGATPQEVPTETVSGRVFVTSPSTGRARHVSEAE